ncbi:MAG: hypothetical protein RR316_01920 [Clostridia bacterium]
MILYAPIPIKADILFDFSVIKLHYKIKLFKCIPLPIDKFQNSGVKINPLNFLNLKNINVAANINLSKDIQLLLIMQTFFILLKSVLTISFNNVVVNSGINIKIDGASKIYGTMFATFTIYAVLKELIWKTLHN